MRLATLLLFAAVGFAQQAPTPVNLSDDTSGLRPIQSLYFYDGSSNLLYRCRAFQVQPVLAIYAVGGSTPASLPTLTNIAVSGGTATITMAGNIGLYAGAQITVTGSATALLNGTYRLLTDSTTTATFTTSAANGTYTDATVATAQPVTSLPYWAINVYIYTSSNLVTSYWANATTAPSLACDARASY